jgi:hypothetical protein
MSHYERSIMLENSPDGISKVLSATQNTFPSKISERCSILELFSISITWRLEGAILLTGGRSLPKRLRFLLSDTLSSVAEEIFLRTNSKTQNVLK